MKNNINKITNKQRGIKEEATVFPTITSQKATKTSPIDRVLAPKGGSRVEYWDEKKKIGRKYDEPNGDRVMILENDEGTRVKMILRVRILSPRRSAIGARRLKCCYLWRKPRRCSV